VSAERAELTPRELSDSVIFTLTAACRERF